MIEAAMSLRRPPRQDRARMGCTLAPGLMPTTPSMLFAWAAITPAM